VQDRIYDKFLELLIAKAKALKFGDGFDDTVASGPLVTTYHYFPTRVFQRKLDFQAAI